MKAFLLVCLVVVTSAKYEEYAGWKSYYVRPSNYDQLTYLGNLVQKLNLDFINHAYVDQDGIVIVHPEVQRQFLKNLEDYNIEFRVHSNDVREQLLKEEEVLFKESSSKNTINSRLSYDRYHTTDDIENYLREIAAAYPRVAKLEIPSNTFEGRPIPMLKVSTTNFEDKSKPIIMIDGGIHGREWLTIPPVTYAIHKLVENVTEPDLLDRYDWILLPMANPDSFNFSIVTSVVWQKTRSTDNHPLSVVCLGADVDRNFDFNWRDLGPEGTPCTPLYPGNRPFSEVETRNLRDILHENLDRLRMYISFDSFGTKVMYPWGYDASLSNRALVLHTVGVSITEAMNKYAEDNNHPFPLGYQVGSEAIVRGYTVGGMSTDYAHYLGVPLVFKIEVHGFFGAYFMPPQYIVPTVLEAWEGIVAGARRAADMF
ncbi:unnamed protein product [Leptosia nina]|uniref:Peptidase M14 domain-containing protein n=1 Tax=Leptosia nina TaxID=320188 RepID=A0AAV1J3C7_9NEOP